MKKRESWRLCDFPEVSMQNRTLNSQVTQEQQQHLLSLFSPSHRVCVCLWNTDYRRGCAERPPCVSLPLMCTGRLLGTGRAEHLEDEGNNMGLPLS